MTAHPMNSTERDLPEDLIKRLRHMAKLLGVGHVDIPSLLTEAADALASIRAERDAAVEALRLEQTAHDTTKCELRDAYTDMANMTAEALE